MKQHWSIVLGSLFFFTTFVKAQSIDSVPTSTIDTLRNKILVRKIVISGLRRTKPFIVHRELSFAEGDSIEAGFDNLVLNRNRIFNTRLFNKVEILARNDTVFIETRERWYTYLMPVLDIADRDFNEWWQTRDRDWRRINYGINLTQNNVRGRNETLKLFLQGGFNNKAAISYSIPYLDKARKIGLSISTAYVVDLQVAYRTENNRLAFTKIEDNARSRFTASANFSYRSLFYKFQYFGIGYSQNEIPDTIAKLNSSYFLDGRLKQKLLSLTYTIVSDHRDIGYYPLKGYYTSFSISKIGLTPWEDANIWTAYVDAAWYRSLGKRWYSSLSFSQKISTPKDQPYVYRKALGYGSAYVSGYELYVIDGQHYSLLKANLKKRLLAFERTFKFIPIPQFRHISFQVFIRAYSDGAIAVDNSYDPGNARLANKFLWGNGLGIDIVTYYDTVLRLEYSVNKDLERGFFVHYKSMF